MTCCLSWLVTVTLCRVWIAGLTPLHLAVKLNHSSLAEMLITAGANVNVADGKSGHTPLHLAAESGQIDIVELLIAKRADVQLASYYGCTPVQSASARAHNKIVKLLGQHGAEAVPENKVAQRFCLLTLSLPQKPISQLTLNSN